VICASSVLSVFLETRITLSGVFAGENGRRDRDVGGRSQELPVFRPTDDDL
jgi:hypothetical protein